MDEEEHPPPPPELNSELESDLDEEIADEADEEVIDEASALADDPLTLAAELVRRASESGGVNFYAINIGNKGDVVGFVGRDAVLTRQTTTSFGAAGSEPPIAEWFRQNPDDAVLMASAAFLPSTSKERVISASRRLSTLLGRVEDSLSFGNPRSLALERIGAAIDNGVITFRTAGRDEAARLCLWREFSTAQRAKLALWLRELGADRRIDVASSVGAAVGSLAASLADPLEDGQADLRSLFSLVIDWWARNGNSTRVALGQALSVAIEKRSEARTFVRTRLLGWTGPRSSRKNRERAANVCVSAWGVAELDEAFAALKRLESTGRDEYFFKAQDAVTTMWVGASLYRDQQQHLANRVVLKLISWSSDALDDVFYRTPQLHLAFAIREELKKLSASEKPLIFVIDDREALQAVADLVAKGMCRAKTAPVFRDMVAELSQYANANGQSEFLVAFYERVRLAIDALPIEPHDVAANPNEPAFRDLFQGRTAQPLSSGVGKITQALRIGASRDLNLGRGVFEDAVELDQNASLSGVEGTFLLGDVFVSGDATRVRIKGVVIRGQIRVSQGSTLTLVGCKLELSKDTPLLNVVDATLSGEDCSVISESSTALLAAGSSTVILKRCALAAGGIVSPTAACMDNSSVEFEACELAQVGYGPAIKITGGASPNVVHSNISARRTAISINDSGSLTCRVSTIAGGQKVDEPVCFIADNAAAIFSNVGIASEGSPSLWACGRASVRLNDALFQNPAGVGIVSAEDADVVAVDCRLEGIGAEAALVAGGALKMENCRLSGANTQSECVVVGDGATVSLVTSEITGPGIGVLLGANARGEFLACRVTGCGSHGIVTRKGAIAYLVRSEISGNRGHGLFAESGSSSRLDACSMANNARSDVGTQEGATVERL